ncbi:isochorismate synthase [Polaribacter gangjinensis]|uniref:isochorismate synthase n=1 Tax=Polaribacter gangjinensis TaxID=574710 RepID=UPI000CF402E8|nr:isochorismate synthase [Polaribacter gangjinensis]
MKIFSKIATSYQENQPFVVYRKPNTKEILALFSKNDSLFLLEDFSESGFVFAPFDAVEKPIFFPFDEFDFFSENINFIDVPIENNNFAETEIQKENHQKIVENAINEIKKESFKKVVISRKESIPLENFDVVLTYKKLLQNYQNAFVYVWFHPKVGLWLGATPETLLTVENLHFETMSLAGTQVADNLAAVIWQQKELEEQSLVTDFIESQLKNKVEHLQISNPETVKAGNLFHLKTAISGTLHPSKSTLKELIESLHPTPAVCGLPRNIAKNFILENENYNREFYTGFLGEMNVISKESKSNKTQLFVNLRCMKIENNFANLFIGGGITKDSNPEKEWQETVSKSKTMKLVL